MLRFNQLLLERGVHKADFKYYISIAHTEAEITAAIDAFRPETTQSCVLSKLENGVWVCAHSRT